jgi:hypothetical protein
MISGPTLSGQPGQGRWPAVGKLTLRHDLARCMSTAWMSTAWQQFGRARTVLLTQTLEIRTKHRPPTTTSPPNSTTLSDTDRRLTAPPSAFTTKKATLALRHDQTRHCRTSNKVVDVTTVVGISIKHSN